MNHKNFKIYVNTVIISDDTLYMLFSYGTKINIFWNSKADFANWFVSISGEFGSVRIKIKSWFLTGFIMDLELVHF